MDDRYKAAVESVARHTVATGDYTRMGELPEQACADVADRIDEMVAPFRQDHVFVDAAYEYLRDT